MGKTLCSFRLSVEETVILGDAAAAEGISQTDIIRRYIRSLNPKPYHTPPSLADLNAFVNACVEQLRIALEGYNSEEIEAVLKRLTTDFVSSTPIFGTTGYGDTAFLGFITPFTVPQFQIS